MTSHPDEEVGEQHGDWYATVERRSGGRKGRSLHNTISIINCEITASDLPIVTADKQTMLNMVVNGRNAGGKGRS